MIIPWLGGGHFLSDIGGNDSFTKVLLHFNGSDASTTFTDSNAGGSAHTWTANGDAKLSTTSPKFGSAAGLFDGTGDWIDTPDHADFTLGSGEFTIDFWLKCSTSGQMYICGQVNAAAGTSSQSFEIVKLSGDTMRAGVYVSTTLSSCTSTTTFTDGVWHHIAFVRTGNTLRLFVDGTQEGGDTAFSGTVNNATDTFSIARNGAYTGTPYNGRIDEFRFSVGVARWTAKFSPPVSPYS